MTAEITTRLKVFVSYARSDGSALAEELVTALEVAGFEGYLDRHDISAGEDWEQRLDTLIRQADTVVFLITPSAVASERCTWELDLARALAKRIIPVLGLPCAEATIPVDLRRLNFINFAPGNSFARGLGQLVGALRLDLDWIREHTRLGELAQRWEIRERVEALLLRDEELAAAQEWLTNWRAELPAATEAQRSYIAASADAQERRHDEERKRNDEMARANTERAAALARQEQAMRALRRRTILAGIGVAALSAGLAGTTVWAMKQRERALEFYIRRESLRRDIAGQIVAYAAAPGQFAIDSGPSGSSPYTTALLEELAPPGVSLWSALSATSTRVNRSSKGDQRPFISSDMNGDLYLSQPSPTRRQHALVIAVGRYPQIPGVQFDGVYKDLAEWEKFLTARGFTFAGLRDPTLDELRHALDGLSIGATAPPAAPDKGKASTAPEAPPDTLLLVVYSGMGFHFGGEKYIGCKDVTLKDAREATPAPDLPGALRVSELEKRARRLAAASVLVYDTQF